MPKIKRPAKGWWRPEKYKKIFRKGPKVESSEKDCPLAHHVENGACKEMESGMSFFVASVVPYCDSLRQYAKPNSDYCRSDEKPHRGQ